MKKALLLSIFVFILFCSFTKSKTFCGPTFRFYNNSSVNITGYQIWEFNSSQMFSGSITITPGNNAIVSTSFTTTGTFAVRVLYATPTTGSFTVWNDIPGEYDCAPLYSSATRSTVIVDISTCDEVPGTLNATACP